MALTSGATHTLQWPGQWVARGRPGANPTKPGLSSDRRLQPAFVKSELLVTAGQHTAVNMFPGLVHTARHVMGVGNTRSRCANRKEATVEGGIGDWDEVVNQICDLSLATASDRNSAVCWKLR